MHIKGSTVLVTGGLRGLGQHITEQLAAAGAARVYATSRNAPHASATLSTPNDWREGGAEDGTGGQVVAVPMDVTNATSIARAAERIGPVDIVVNNAGVTMPAALAAADLVDVRALFETNVFGALAVTQAFLPDMRARGTGHIVNIASVLSWLSGAGPYGASKAALWSLTNSLRLELAGDGIAVTGAYLGYTDTDMTAGVDAEKNDPADVARQIIAGIQHDNPEVLADPGTRAARQALSGPVDQQTWQAVTRSLTDGARTNRTHEETP